MTNSFAKQMTRTARNSTSCFPVSLLTVRKGTRFATVYANPCSLGMHVDHFRSWHMYSIFVRRHRLLQGQTNAYLDDPECDHFSLYSFPPVIWTRKQVRSIPLLTPQLTISQSRFPPHMIQTVRVTALFRCHFTSQSRTLVHLEKALHSVCIFCYITRTYLYCIAYLLLSYGYQRYQRLSQFMVI